MPRGCCRTTWLRCGSPRLDAPGLVALAYGPSELRTDVAGTTFNIVQETQYPFGDQVRMTVEAAAPAELTLWLRRPAWAKAIHLDGVESVEVDGWIVIARQWHGRASFTLRFDMAVEAEAYPDGEVAVMRGPLQYVQQIPHYVRELPVAGRPGWPDAELFAEGSASLEVLPILDAARADLGYVVERVATKVPDRPWVESPLRLRKDGVTLIPLGCAPLRRAAFRVRVLESKGKA